MRIRTLRMPFSFGWCVSVLSVLMIMGLGCGGSSSTGGKTASDGRVYMTNLSTEDIRVSYFTEETGEIETVVERFQRSQGEPVEISQGNVAGGTVLTFKLHAFSPCSGGKIDVELTVDGSVTIRVTSAVCQSGVILYEITGG